jgi:tRNA threonylcarbamoyladenosine biosynthesis protein TsaE
MHTYQGRLALHHFDAWMEGREQAFLEGGGAEWLRGEGVAVVEWAERLGAWLPEPRLSVRLEHLDPERRRIRIAVVGEDPEGRLRALLEALGPPPGVGEEE